MNKTKTHIVITILTVGCAASLFGQAAPPPATPAQPSLPILQPVPAPAPAAPAAPAADASASGSPKIQFATPSYDFGKVKSGDPVKYTFYFTNNGDSMLFVSNVQPSCGCTTAGEWSKQVEPGKSGMIPVQFNSANYNGSVMKNVTVTSNAKETPSVVLQLHGTVWKMIEVNPQFAMLNVPPDSTQTVSSVVTIKNNMDEALDVFAPESNNKSFTVELKTNTPGKDYQLVISTVPPMDSGTVQGQITMKTSATNSPTINVTAWANVQQAITVSPPNISLPAGPLPAQQTMTVNIQNNAANPVTISEPTVNDQRVEVKLEEPAPGKTFRALLTFPQGFELAQGTASALSLKCSSARMPVIKVPVMQLPRPAAPQIIPLQPQPTPASTAPAANQAPAKTASQ